MTAASDHSRPALNNGQAGKIFSGWVRPARHVRSPNFDQRPPGTEVSAVVVHCISLPPGQFGGPEIEYFFCNCLDPAAHGYFREIAHLRVSSHFLIRRNGELVQFVATDHRAWHAGESVLEGRPAVNDFSIGIELEGTDCSPFEDAQYQTLGELTRLLRHHYPAITLTRLVGHCDIAPARKTDPGTCFDWPRYRASAGA